MALNLGRTLIIANPAAHGGRGRRGAATICRVLDTQPEATSTYELRLTTAAGEATGIAAESATYDTVIALGGDGLIHEVLQGLMQLPVARRPTLALIPYGSGNDYARTLGIRANSPRVALRQALEGRIRDVEVGKVNGVYFAETLSFGLDSAIALAAREAHAEGAGGGGLGHYMDNGLKIFSREAEPRVFRARFDDGDEVAGAELAFAVQVGPTYGGGFSICPAASPADGLLSVCYTSGHPSVPHTLGLFGLAKFGAHTGSKHIVNTTCRTLTLDFDEVPPVQLDGEPIETSTHFEIEVVPAALRVIANSEVRW